MAGLKCCPFINTWCVGIECQCWSERVHDCGLKVPYPVVVEDRREAEYPASTPHEEY